MTQRAQPQPPPRIATIAAALDGPLPDRNGHRLMWPEHLPQRGLEDAPEDARLASVLILLYEHEGRTHFPLQRRTSVDGDPHTGQISLPGGSREADETPEQTALRETHEELGVDPSNVRLLGRLSRRWIPVSGFKVQSVVGWVDEPPAYIRDPVEVEEILISSLEELEEPDRLFSFERKSRYGTLEIPAWRLAGGTLWGATAMILAELMTLLRRAEGAPPLRLPRS